MKADRAFIELHDGGDVVLIDLDHIYALIGETNTTIHFTGFAEGFIVDESPREVIALIHELYVKAHALRGAD